MVNERLENNRDRELEVRDYLKTISFKRGDSILDIGAGTGWASKIFYELGLSVTAIDFDLSAFDSSLDGVKRVEKNFLKYRPRKRFDFVFASHVLEHFASPGNAISAIRSCLKENGQLIVAVPKYTEFATEGHWHTGWNIPQLGNLLTNSGFDCRNSVFSVKGLSVLGSGVKVKKLQNNLSNESDLRVTRSLMPEKYSKAFFSERLDSTSISFLSASDYTPGTSKEVISAIEFEALRALTLSSPKNTCQPWWEFLSSPLNMDLSKGTFLLQTFSSLSNPVNARVIFGFGTGSESSDLFENHGDYWVTVEPGYQLTRFSPDDFIRRQGMQDWANASIAGFGGPNSLSSGEFFAKLSWNFEGKIWDFGLR